MNEHIKQLAVQAGFKFGTSTAANEAYQEQKIEQLVKLIVQECASLANNKSQGSENPGDGHGLIFYYDADISDLIKKHFGVK